MSHKSRFQAILQWKCPRCYKGNLFSELNPYKLKDLSKMPETCVCCGQRTHPEPGFYYGAMYLSYGLSVVFSLLVFIFVELIFKFPSFYFLFINSFLLIVLWPVIFRYARVLYLYMFIDFKPTANNN